MVKCLFGKFSELILFLLTSSFQNGKLGRCFAFEVIVLSVVIEPYICTFTYVNAALRVCLLEMW